MSDNAQAVINDNAGVIENFVMKYLLDNGVSVQLLEAVAKALFNQQVVMNGTVPEGTATAPKEMLATAVGDVITISAWSDPEFDLQRVIDGAASLEFLVRYARLVDPRVIPPEVIPSDEVVSAALELFNAPKVNASASV